MDFSISSPSTLILEVAKHSPLPETHILYQCLQKHNLFNQPEYACWIIKSLNNYQLENNENVQFISVPKIIPENLHKLYIASELIPKIQIISPT